MTDLTKTIDWMQDKADAATEGPWIVRFGAPFSVWQEQADTWTELPVARHVQSGADAEFIAMARTAMPALLSALKSILALCDEHDESERYSGVPWGDIPVVDARKALTDALEGGESAS